jgi:hypothetical protein
MATQQQVTQYLISAVYLDNNTVTHFFVHQFYNPGVGSAHKLSKDQLKQLFERPGISVYTAEWNYREGKFIIVQQAFLKIFKDSFYFHILPEDHKTKNLRHLINLSWYGFSDTNK